MIVDSLNGILKFLKNPMGNVVRALAAVPVVLFAAAPSEKPWILAINEDNDRYMVTAKGEALTEKGVRDYFDSVAAGGAVTHFFMCVNGQRTSYDSKVWEPIWLGVNDRTERGHTNAPWCVNAKILHDRGIDVWKIWCEQAREKGISPWISMRMNDAHYCSYMYKVHRNENFWWDHPEWWRVPHSHGKKGYALQALDFAHAEVRKHAMDLVKEILGRWDMDGIEIDWMRQRCCLTPGKERELAYLLTDFMREVRFHANAAGRRLGHPVKVAVRVSSFIAGAEANGFDIVTWAKEGLVDVVIPSVGYWTPDYNMKVDEWRTVLGSLGRKITILPSTDIGMQSFNRYRMLIWHDMAFLRGWAANASGGDGIYLFNAPYYGKDEKAEVYAGALSPERIVRSRRRFPVTYHEYMPKRELEDKQLPCKLVDGAELRVQVTRGAFDSRARLVIATGVDCKNPPEVSVNGMKLKSEAVKVAIGDVFPKPPKWKCSFLSWDVPLEAVRTGENKVRFENCASPGSVVWCEFILDADVKSNKEGVK